jgi:hypothetical protein
LPADQFQHFLTLFAPALPESRHRLGLDNSGAHTAQRLTVPEPVRRVFWPPSGPELNSRERLWRDLPEALAWLQFPHLEGQQDQRAMSLRAYEAATLPSLTASPDLVEAMHARCP